MADIGFQSSKAGQTGFASGTFAPVLFSYRVPSGGDFKPVRIFLGAGIANFELSQDFAVEAVNSMGFGNIVEHVTHAVQANSFTITKMMLIAEQLAKAGISPFGMDNFAAPKLDATIINSLYQSTLARSGNDQAPVNDGVTYVELTGLHTRSNRISGAVNQILRESVTFAVDNFAVPRDEGGSKGRLLRDFFRKVSPQLFKEYEDLQKYSVADREK